MGKKLESGWLPILLILLYFSISVYSSKIGVFVDESDNIYGGHLINHGYLIYQDFFSHHAPFPYYWVAWIFKVLGESILVARWSIIALELIVWSIAIKITKYRQPITVFLVLYSAIKSIYFGQMVIYHVFVGITSTALFAITLYILTKENATKNAGWISTALLGTIALWSDLQSIYLIGVVLVFLLLYRKSRKMFLRVVFLMFIINFVVIITMWKMGILDNFIRDAVKFNLEIYSKYTNAVRISWFNQILNQMSNAFYVYRLDLFPIVGWPDVRVLSDPNRWWLTGGLYRLSFIFLTIFWLSQRKLMAAFFVYLYGATVIVRSPSYFHSIPFVMASLFALSFLITNGLHRLLIFLKNHTNFDPLFTKIWKMLSFVVVLLGIMGMWLSVYGAYRTFQMGTNTFFDFQKNYYNQIIREINDLSCGNRDVYLGFFPGDPMVHFLSGLYPVSRFIYLFPWTAEIGLEETIRQLNHKKSVVFIDVNGIIWSKYRVKDYLSELIQHLNRNYLLIKEGMYVSYNLAASCLFESSEISPLYFNSIAWFIKTFEKHEEKHLIILTENVARMDYFKSISDKVRLVNPINGMLWPNGPVCYLVLPDSLRTTLSGWKMRGTWEEVPFMGLRWRVFCEKDPLAPFQDLRPLQTWEKGIALLGFTIRGDLVPGGLLEVEHLWRYEGQSLSEPIVFYNHLLKEGQLVAQADGVSVSSDQWRRGDVIGARFIIRIPDSVPPGVYQLRIGLYTWPSLQRLNTLHGEDGFTLRTWR